MSYSSMSWREPSPRRKSLALSLQSAERSLDESSRRQSLDVVEALHAHDFWHHWRQAKWVLILVAVVFVFLGIQAFRGVLDASFGVPAAIIGVGVAAFFLGRAAGAQYTFRSVKRSFNSDGRTPRRRFQKV